MSNLDKKIGAPALPSVNLIPKEIAEATKMRTIKVTALFAVLVAVGVMVAVYVLALGATQLAKSSLNDAVSEETDVINTRDQQVTVYEDYVSQEEDAWTLGQIGYGETKLSALTFGIANALGDNDRLLSLSFYGPTAEGFDQRNLTATTSFGVGSIAATVNSESYEAATEAIAAIEAVAGVTDVVGTVESYATASGVVVWETEITATVTENALTGRFIDPESTIGVDPSDVLSDVEVEAEPEDEPSPEPSASEEE
ncbi:hypothetical protein [Demequina sediminicola]|uniref:hypothetical protein n=1 Tax=Demequina sediminicola TaxID=1095026 RepID=UPI0007859EA7|nr:hypothetical protein [Demequina sediminicola]